jgi:hypothetical protein
MIALTLAGMVRADAVAPVGGIDMTKGAVVRTRCEPTTIDTRAIPFDQTLLDVTPPHKRRVREMIPPHATPPEPFFQSVKGAGALPEPPGSVMEKERVAPAMQWPALGDTGWTPPDPTLAVGPSHIVLTVNSRIAFYTKDGVATFAADLGSQGSPGFFEPVGGSTFCFDPKCVYDTLSGRFFVLALEAYPSPQQAFITIAVSDDSDPNGVWHKYRTDAALVFGVYRYWWDYPGLGVDDQGLYVTGNLFGFANGPFGGVGFRVFDKSALLNGQPAWMFTLRDANATSVQAVQHFGAPIAPIFVSRWSNAALKLYALRNPLTAPQLTSTTLSVPFFQAPTLAPTPWGEGTLLLIDHRPLNAVWREGRLLTTHHVLSGSKNLARWYDIATGQWPVSGAPVLTQSGEIDPGPGMHSSFPAIAVNGAGDVGMVMNTSSLSQPISVAITARRADDPAGVMGLPHVVRAGDAPGGGRWGDYHGACVDPIDDSFWAVGEFATPTGWATWIGNFTAADASPLKAQHDDAGTIFAPGQRLIDALANDTHEEGQSFVIESFSTISQRGGAIAMSFASGAGGRDQLLYTPPMGVNGADSFTYVLRDTSGRTATATVTINVFDTTMFRAPDATGPLVLGLDASYYELASPASLPDFGPLWVSEESECWELNFPSTPGPLGETTLEDNVGAEFTGYFLAPRDDYYTFTIESDEGSRLSLGGQVLIDNDGLHAMRAASASIGLRAGAHALRVEWFDATGPSGLVLRRRGTSTPDEAVPGAELARDALCDSIDFNNDGLSPDPVDVDDFLTVFSGGACPTGTCNDIDFNNDGLYPDSTDIDALLRVFAGGACW